MRTDWKNNGSYCRKVIKVVNYLDGTNKILDKEGMGYGNYVMVLHKGNLVTLYGHLEHVTVNEGQEINQGTVIGYMGNTGISYGAHLHFEIRKYNRSLENINLHNKDYLDSLILNHTLIPVFL